MSSIYTREEQLSGLRVKAEKKLKTERDLLASAIQSGVMPAGSTKLFSRPGQYPGWHIAVGALFLDAVQLRAYSIPVAIQRFYVEDGALAAEFNGEAPGVVERLLNDSLRAATANACCNCGDRRDNQPLSVERMACASCVFVDLSFENDIEAKAANAWVPLTEH